MYMSQEHKAKHFNVKPCALVFSIHSELAIIKNNFKSEVYFTIIYFS